MEKISSGIGGNIPLDPSSDSDPAVGSSALSVANGIQQSSPSGISSAVDVFEKASEGNALNQAQGSLAPDAAILPPATFFNSAPNLSTFDAEVAQNLQDPNFDPNQSMQDLHTKLQDGVLDPNTQPSGVIEDHVDGNTMTPRETLALLTDLISGIIDGMNSMLNDMQQHIRA